MRLLIQIVLLLLLPLIVLAMMVFLGVWFAITWIFERVE